MMKSERIHELKCWPQYFDAVVSGEKTFEVRRDDRGFQTGDVVELQRTYEDMSHAVKRDINGIPSDYRRFKIGWILTGGQLGIEPGYIVFSLEPLE